MIWLRADPVTLAARVAEDDHRPLLGDDPLAMLTEMARTRAALYAECADLVVEADRMDAEAVASRIADTLRDRIPST